MGTYNRIFAICNMNGAKIDAKFSLLSNFLFEKDVDFLMLQEVSVDVILNCKNYIDICNTGEKNRGTGFLIRKGLSHSQLTLGVSGRASSLIFENVNTINIYAPSGTDEKTERNKFFKNDIAKHLIKNGVQFSLAGGDFNCVLDPKDNKSDNVNDCPALRTLIRDLGWVDIWRELKRDEIGFTFQRGKSASRLDRFYCSPNFLPFVKDI